MGTQMDPNLVYPAPFSTKVTLWPPKGPPREPWQPPRHHFGPQEAHFGAPGASKGPQGSNFGHQKTAQGLHFDTFWEPWAHLIAHPLLFSILDLEKACRDARDVINPDQAETQVKKRKCFDCKRKGVLQKTNRCAKCSISEFYERSRYAEIEKRRDEKRNLGRQGRKKSGF